MAERDLTSVINHLKRLFESATDSLDKAARNNKTGDTNLAYKLETKFAYALNELMQGPACTAQRYIAICNDIIDEAMQLAPRANKARNS